MLTLQIFESFVSISKTLKRPNLPTYIILLYVLNAMVLNVSVSSFDTFTETCIQMPLNFTWLIGPWAVKFWNWAVNDVRLKSRLKPLAKISKSTEGRKYTIFVFQESSRCETFEMRMIQVWNWGFCEFSITFFFLTTRNLQSSDKLLLLRKKSVAFVAVSREFSREKSALHLLVNPRMHSSITTERMVNITDKETTFVKNLRR